MKRINKIRKFIGWRKKELLDVGYFLKGTIFTEDKTNPVWYPKRNKRNKR